MSGKKTRTYYAVTTASVLRGFADEEGDAWLMARDLAEGRRFAEAATVIRREAVWDWEKAPGAQDVLHEETLGTVPVPAGFDPDVWEKREGSPYMHKVRRRTYAELRDHVLAGLGGVRGLECEPGFEYLSWSMGERAICTLRPEAELPDYRWAIAWAVTGGSEGHYVHVELVCPPEREGPSVHVPVALAKTFGGWAAAHRLAGRIARLLGA